MFATMYKPISEYAPSWADTKITDIFKIISYSYTKKFYEVGSFSMVIPINEPSAELLETNTFLATNDGDYLFVTGIKETESRITLEGYDLKYLLAGRITLFPSEEQDTGTYGYYVTKGSTGECICDIVRHNITEASDPNRRIYGFSVTNSAQGLAEDTYMTRLEPLDQVVATLCKNAGIGYDVTMEIGSSLGDSIQFKVIQPTDRSEKQTDVPKVIFAKSFLNVESLSREIGVDAEKNAIYAINGTNIDDAVVKLVNRDGEDKADYGVYRRETTVNVNCDVDEIDSYALKEAEDFISTDSFIMEAAAAESYKKEWFVGDIVTFRHKDITRHVPIIAAEIQRTAEKFTVKLSAGESPLKPVSGISRTANKAVDEITQKKFDDGYVLTVKELPSEGLKNKIYVLEEEKSEVALLSDETGTEETEEAKIIDGYIFVEGEWRKFGGGDSSGGVGEFTNEAKNSEIFNSYEDVINDKGIVTRKKNYINFDTQYAHVSGYSNSIDKSDKKLTAVSAAASVLGGTANTILSSALTAILGGMGNSIDTQSLASCIIGGANNRCKGQYSVCMGLDNIISDCSMSFIGSGGQNKLTEANYTFICGGQGNSILRNFYSAIIGGSYNQISSGKSNGCSGIFAGASNVVEGVHNCIVGGQLNRINEDVGANNVVIGGYSNKISDGANNCVALGNNNIISGKAANSLIIGNSNKCARSNSIICGNNATIENSGIITVGSVNGNVFYVTGNGEVYAKSFNIIGATPAAYETYTASSMSESIPDLSALTEQINHMKSEIESLKTQIAELKGVTQ